MLTGISGFLHIDTSLSHGFWFIAIALLQVDIRPILRDEALSKVPLCK